MACCRFPATTTTWADDQAAASADLSGSKWWVAGDANPVATFATIPGNDTWLSGARFL